MRSSPGSKCFWTTHNDNRVGERIFAWRPVWVTASGHPASARNGRAKETAGGASLKNAARVTPSGREGRARDGTVRLPGQATSTIAMKCLRRFCASGGTAIQRGAIRLILPHSAEDFLGTSHESEEVRITGHFLAGLATWRETSKHPEPSGIRWERRPE